MIKKSEISINFDALDKNMTIGDLIKIEKELGANQNE